MKKIPESHTRLVVEAVSAILRYGALSAQLGLAAGVIVYFIACVGGCGGYAEAYWAYATGLLAAITAAIYMIMRHMSIRESMSRLQREARWQWTWIVITIFISIPIFY